MQIYCRFIADLLQNGKVVVISVILKRRVRLNSVIRQFCPKCPSIFLPCVWPCTTFAWCNLSIFAILEMAVVMHLGWMTLTLKTTRFNLSRVKNKEGSCLRNFLLQNESLSVNTCKRLPHLLRKKVNGYQKAVKLKKSRMEGDVWKTSLILIFPFYHEVSSIVFLVITFISGISYFYYFLCIFGDILKS